jgi:Membrane bound beta barrel domain (DUF5777)
MRKIIVFFTLFAVLHAAAQDTTMNSLTKGMDEPAASGKKPVKIFNSEKIINANTTEVVPKGKMDFKVTHNFGDIAGHEGGIKKFFGFDNSSDVRIGFDIGLTNRLTLSVAHAKGDDFGIRRDTLNGPGISFANRLYEISLKYQLLRQLENDPSHPIAVSIFAQTVISTIEASNGAMFSGFKNSSDRWSQVLQIIIAKKIGKVSAQINPTLVHYNYIPTSATRPDFDKATTFALGGAIRIPLSNSFALIVDYFHPFLADAKKTNYYDSLRVKFHDPLGIGFEIITAGHVFHLNFTNVTATLENQFIPYTTSSWGKGRFRWGFNISRTFVLWREKK